MPRRTSEITQRPTLTAPDKPRIVGAEETIERDGITLQPLVPEIENPDEQEAAFLERFEAWRAGTNGSLPEFVVWEFLTITKNQLPGFDFVFQHPVLGGRTRFGGFILDYFFQMRMEGWRIQGERFHLEKPRDRARDHPKRAR